jgi:multidrug resistance efflux pump
MAAKPSGDAALVIGVWQAGRKQAALDAATAAKVSAERQIDVLNAQKVGAAAQLDQAKAQDCRAVPPGRRRNQFREQDRALDSGAPQRGAIYGHKIADTAFVAGIDANQTPALWGSSEKNFQHRLPSRRFRRWC